MNSAGRVVVFPDVELALLGFLRPRPALSGVTFGTALPDDLDRRLPFVRLSRIGGRRVLRLVLDDARIDIEARASSRHQAHRVMQILLAELEVARDAVHDGVRIYDVTVETGPAWLPDPLSAQPRWITTVLVRNRPV